MMIQLTNHHSTKLVGWPKVSVMPDFALVFRSGGPLPPDDLARRNAAARDWALALRDAGRLRVASPLEDACVRVGAGVARPVAEPAAVAAILVIEAADLDAAVALAEGHPGLAFGTEIDVRPVKPTGPALLR